MGPITIAFTVHVPQRLRTDYSFFEIGKDHQYFDTRATRLMVETMAQQCYLPSAQVLYDLLRRHEGRFRFSLSISGPALRLLSAYAPDTLEAYKRLIKTGWVELLGESSYHSLASLKSPKEFSGHLASYRKTAQELFGVNPQAFRHTEMIYQDNVAKLVEEAGYRTMLAEGLTGIGEAKSPQQIYHATGGKLRVLLRHPHLSEDVSKRFSDPSWAERPLTVEKYASWLQTASHEGDTVNLFMDARALGHWNVKESGIFDFLWHLPETILAKGLSFATVSEAAAAPPAGPISVPVATSWAAPERDLSSWTGNPLQDSALQYLYELEKAVVRSKNEELLALWRDLQEADYLDWMCTRRLSGGTPHRQPSPFASPYDGYVAYINMLNDFRETLKAAGVRV